ncbi:DUF1294 domain-containing protein [Sinanaerobacter chloroacetimidivorans]|uniref:DUF1294 domain-containing protein n=1 Tax=Sinanaerobacter chloroacetimidivorans TaxID=2818044 RepID=A0A8J8B0N9_9FIRM|nr:DUF1294 domain-containing protein [Sinanaerobacter chloroacetimidivorans]MBR0596977.1 DUF1294 domain-containing protein [Sinanaerobacter chloroacetimidivorans]
MKYAIYILAGWNLITFLIMGLDKYKSSHGKWRISEQTLLNCSFAMGGLGCLLGALIFHHKTSKWKFRIFLPIGLLFNLSVIYLIWYYIL